MKRMYDLKKICFGVTFEWQTHISWIDKRFAITLWPFHWKTSFTWHPGNRTLNLGPLAILWYDGLVYFKHEHPDRYKAIFEGAYEDIP